MTLNADTFGSDVLARVGVANAFGDRLRLYPLAADLGKTAPQDAGGRDVRYPRVTLDEVAARGAELIVLPDEPHAFSAADEAVLREALPTARVVRVSGKDLFWYGAWTIDALPRLRAQLTQLSRRTQARDVAIERAAGDCAKNSDGSTSSSSMTIGWPCVVAREVDAAVEDRDRVRRERGLGDRALVVGDRERPVDALAVARRTAATCGSRA